MKAIEIGAESRPEHWDRERIGCRGIVLRDGFLLLSHETVSGLWMIPGGGLEGEESSEDCCIREVAEETGFLIRPEACALEITEYFRSWKLVNRYFPGEVVREVPRHLTDREAGAGMEPRWVAVEEARRIFGAYAEMKEGDLRWGLYRREYTALTELFGKG